MRFLEINQEWKINGGSIRLIVKTSQPELAMFHQLQPIVEDIEDFIYSFRPSVPVEGSNPS